MQRMIAAVLDGLRGQLASFVAEFAKLQQIRAGLMRDLLTGHVLPSVNFAVTKEVAAAV